jgi:TatA/E family protein of Tat protein translocase
MPIIGNIGPLELLLVLALALLILGPGKLPEVGAAFGRTIREFRKATTEVNEAVNINPPPATPATPPAPQASAAPAETIVTAPSAPAAPAEPTEAQPASSEPSRTSSTGA